ncbi:carboxymuconolactone decarboxylase family protein [Novosphingobium flavum]|uniref:carboxymuconolactone decarboxylase family protein n=1 Tax=Novosphingobium aerophilum TaxID=2839843 RepID=UPI00163AE705|nr:carboxymuconolactone decarboxylase family protein [Novosphingobium aerophilum]MBC2660370.1 carboxymuconolactone decarboxylase family protein [Novosphingobium aerophilum]
MTHPAQRIPPLPKDEWTDAARDVFAFWGEPNAREEGSKTSILPVMGQHPGLGMAYNHWGKQLLLANTLSTRHLELLILRIAWRVQSAYEWHHHVGYALNCGITLEEIAAVKTYPADHDWAEDDAAVLTTVDELLTTNTVSDATWAVLERLFEVRQRMDLVFTVGHYVMTSWALSAFGVPVEPWADQIGFDLRTRSGKVPQRTLKPGEGDGWADGRD